MRRSTLGCKASTAPTLASIRLKATSRKRSPWCCTREIWAFSRSSTPTRAFCSPPSDLPLVGVVDRRAEAGLPTCDRLVSGGTKRKAVRSATGTSVAVSIALRFQ